MAHNVKCADCIFAVLDETTRDGSWVGVECSHENSVYHKSLLNITRDGNKLDSISWSGCAFGVSSISLHERPQAKAVNE